MLLNQSLQPNINVEEIPEIEPMILLNHNNPIKDFSIYNENSQIERKNSSKLNIPNPKMSFSKNYFEDLYQDQKFLDSKLNANPAQKSIKIRSISNSSKTYSVKKGPT